MATLCKAVLATVENNVGALAEVSEKITAAGVNIRAFAGWAEGAQGKVEIVCSDPDKACAAICDSVQACEFAEVVCVETQNQPGALRDIARKLADAKINIIAAFASPGDADKATIVLTTMANAKAAEILG